MATERTYRHLVRSERLLAFGVKVQETDLMIHANANLEKQAKELVFKYRGHIEAYIEQNPAFLDTLAPWPSDGPYPEIIGAMVQAGRWAQVGPMAAVAGALAEYVGQGLIGRGNTDEVIVENGGDIYIKTNTPATIAVFAGQSPLSLRVGLHFSARDKPFAVCTSSGTVGHSFSHGKADAVCVVAASCALADAAATAIGNRIQSSKNIQAAIDWGQKIGKVDGILAIVGDAMGLWGEIEVTPL